MGIARVPPARLSRRLTPNLPDLKMCQSSTLQMTDAEPSTAPAAPANHGPGFDAYGPLPDYDESLLDKGKNGRPRKPVKPDDSERTIAIDKFQAEIKKFGDRIAEIKALEASRKNRTAPPEVQEHRRRKAELNKEWQAVRVRHLVSAACMANYNCNLHVFTGSETGDPRGFQPGADGEGSPARRSARFQVRGVFFCCSIVVL